MAIEDMLAKVGEIVGEIVLDVGRDKVQSAKEQRVIKEKLDEYLRRKLKNNWCCAIEEEIDFEGLAQYIRGDMIEDVQQRVFGNKEERSRARKRIQEKAECYATAKTQLSKKRALDMALDVTDMIRDFYRKEVPKGMLLVTGEIEEKISDAETHLSSKIDESSLLSANLRLMQEKQYDKVEDNLNLEIKAIESQHPVPGYGLEVRTNGLRKEIYSIPLTEEAVKKYPPTLEIEVKATLAGKPIEKFTPYYQDYAYRHQIPIVLDVVSARKYLGNELDPYQHEAEHEVGNKHVITPPPFPPALPCNLVGDDGIILEYMLLRTKEILDDGTCIMSNEEQDEAGCIVSVALNMRKSSFSMTLCSRTSGNSGRLQKLKLIREIRKTTKVRIHVLGTDDDWVSGKAPMLMYETIFGTIDKDIEFLEKVVDIENYFHVQIELPDMAYNVDLRHMEYLAELVRNKKCDMAWSETSVTCNITPQFRDAILGNNLLNYRLEAGAEITIDLWDHQYKLTIRRVIPNVIFKDPERLQEKLKILDDGDPIKVIFIPKNVNEKAEDYLVE